MAESFLIGNIRGPEGKQGPEGKRGPIGPDGKQGPTGPVNTIMISDLYDSAKTYKSGEYCIYNNALWKANQNINTPEAWNSAHWTSTLVGTELSALNARSIYPVGSIYLSVNSTNPSTLFGGKWEQIQGRFLLGAGGGYAAGSTGGEAAHVLTVDEIATHNHVTVPSGDVLFASNGTSLELAQGNFASRSKANQYTTGTAGRSVAHNNMPPYLTVYIWKRVA